VPGADELSQAGILRPAYSVAAPDDIDEGIGWLAATMRDLAS
jgi:hypothetical protein